MLSNPHFHPDLIVLDLNIPKVSGVALLELMKGGKTPVVVFSSCTNPDEKEHSLALGARAFVSKPGELQQYSETVRKIIEEWAVPQPGFRASIPCELGV
jgi:DNA-binding NarL/FixJ family response regulator